MPRTSTIPALGAALLLACASATARAENANPLETPRYEPEFTQAFASQPQSSPDRPGLFVIASGRGQSGSFATLGLALVAAFGLSIALIGWSGGWNAGSRND